MMPVGLLNRAAVPIPSLLPGVPITRDIAYRPACKVDGPDAVILVIGNVERTAAYGYAYRSIKLRGSARAGGIPRRTAAGKVAYRPACKVDGSDAMTMEFGNVERVSTYS